MEQHRHKLLMVTECFGGGVYAYLSQLCNDMCDDFDVYLAYSTREQTPENYKKNLDPRIHLVAIDGFGDVSNPFAVRRTIRRLRMIASDIKPSAIHLHSSIAGAVGRIAFSEDDYNLVYTPHGYAFMLLGDGPKSAAYRFVEKALGNRALTLNCCESEDEVAKSLGKRSTYIETGVNIRALEETLSGVDAERFGRFTVFALGKAYVQKQPWLFNRVAELVPDADFIWIGGGELEKELVAPNVTCTGWLPREEALSIARGANAFILCSKGEAIAMSLLEAMYLEKLVLVSDVMGNRSVVQDGRNGFVCRTAEEYASRIAYAMDTFPHELASQARNDIDSIYNTDVMKSRFVDFYLSVIERGTSRFSEGDK